MFKLTVLGLAVLLLTACESQKPARQLAANAALNTAQLAAALSQVAASERNVAKKRAKTLADYDRAVRESKAALAFDLAITKESGDSAATNLLAEIEDWIVKAEREAAVVGGSAAEQEQALLAQQQKINTKAEQLAAVAKALNELAKEQSTFGRAAFLAGYTKEVHALLKASAEAASAAEGSADKAKGEIDAASKTLPKASSGESDTQ